MASFRADAITNTAYSVYFSEDLIKLTEMTVPPASISFMGEYVVDLSMNMKGADTCHLTGANRSPSNGKCRTKE